MTSRSAITRVAQALVLVGLLLANLRWAGAYLNWDMLAYIASAHRFGGESVEEAHRATYETLRASVPASSYEILSRDSDYRRTLANDPVAFGQHLPFFSVKPVYPLMILGLWRLGMNEVEASVAINRVVYVATGLLVLVWLSAFLSPVASTITAWGVMSVPFMLSLGRLSTPDPLSTLAVLLALWLTFERQKPGAGAAFMVASILVRPDNIVWVVLLAAYHLIKGDRRAAFATGAAGLLIYFGLTQWAGSYGWRTLFHHSFIERVNFPATFVPTLTLQDYLRTYLGAGHPKNLPPYLALFALIGPWLLIARARRHDLADAWTSLLGLVVAFSILHWIAYPGADRFRTPVYAVLLIGLIRTILPEEAPGEHRAAGS